MEQKSRWKNNYAIETAFDNLSIGASEITDIIRGTIEARNKYLKRAELKPMAKERGDKDSHDTSRALHMRQAAEIGKTIAHRLGLNETVAYTGMFMHDAGHAFFGHEGEHTMNVAGKLLHIGYFHHNAKGIDVIMAENLIGKIVDAIPEAKGNEELRKKLEEDAWYFLDVVVSHDGEANSKENKITKKKSDSSSIKETVLEKVRKSNRENIYKCDPETLESIISKPADVIAYIKSDMIDAFSDSIITELDNDYFEVIGGILGETNEERIEALKTKKSEDLRLERIEKGKQLLLEYRKKHLRELPEDIDSEILEITENIIKQTQDEGLNIFNVHTKEDIEQEMNEDIKKLKEKLKSEEISSEEYRKRVKKAKSEFVYKYRQNEIAQRRINEILEDAQEEYRIKKGAEGIDKNTIESGVRKIEEYTQKLTKERKRVIEEIMNDIQEELIADYVETTKENWEGKENYEDMKVGMGFSEPMEKLLYNRLKRLDYENYVQYTKKIYQERSVPSATFKTIKQCAKALVKTGVIRDKFYDPIVLSKIENEEVRKYMKVPERDEEEYKKFRRKIGISKGIKLIRPKKRDKKKRFIGKNKIYLRKLYKEMYSYTQMQDTRFALNCEDVYCAIEHTVRNLVEDAYSEKFNPDDYLKQEQEQELKNIKRKIRTIQQNLIGDKKVSKQEEENYLEQAKEQYILETIESERENLEEKVAQEISTKYIAGMGDRRIKDVLIKIGNLSPRVLKREDKINKEGNKVVKGLAEKHKEKPEEKDKKEEKTR